VSTNRDKRRNGGNMTITRASKGALVLFLVVFGAMLAIWLLLPSFKEHQEIQTSDAGAANTKGTLTVLVDNFVGYAPLCSSYLKNLMLAAGWRLDCSDDGADYSSRYRRVGDGDVPFAVATIDSFVAARNYNSVIKLVIDRSVGADGLECDTAVADSIAALKPRLDIKVAYTPDSPSHQFLRALAVDFGIPLFKISEGDWRVETAGSKEAYQALLSGKTQCAVLWEPNLSQAVAKGYSRIITTKDMPNTIVDALVVNRRFLSDNPEVVRTLFANYFLTLKYYRDHPDELEREVARWANVPAAEVHKMLAGVEWQTLEENATKWFGLQSGNKLGHYGLVDAVDRNVTVLTSYGDMTDNPLPAHDPRRIINSEAVAALYKGGVSESFLITPSATPLETDFIPLTPEAWSVLREVGPLQDRNVIFQSGSASLTIDGKRALDEAAESLKAYPNFRLEVQGHTSKQGDEAANVALSQQRAEAVKRYLTVTYKVDPDRIRAVGKGSAVPLNQSPDEPYRAFIGRLMRVELHLKREVI
jgi:outer membrane protein OmpA-like peptidoglycan-associated protein